jgi:hypothetical protein
VAGLLERLGHAWSEHVEGRMLRRGVGFFVDAEKARSALLSYPVDDGVVVGDRFHVKPLFRNAKISASFDVLALSEQQVRLFRGDGLALRQLDLGTEVPQSLTDVAGSQPAGRHLGHHAGDRGSERAIFHGHGAGKDDSDAELERFLRELDQALATIWRFGQRAVVLAGVKRLLASFRSVAASRNIVDEEIHGNVEHLTAGELHERAWPIIDRRLERHRQVLLEELENSGPNTPVVRQVADAVRAAAEGRVDTVFVANDAACWGELAEDGFQIERHEAYTPGSQDLLDFVAVQCHLHGGTVYALSRQNIPGNGLVVARLRY